MNAHLRRKFWKAGMLDNVAPEESKQTVSDVTQEVETKVVELKTEVVEVEEVKPKTKKTKKVVDEAE